MKNMRSYRFNYSGFDIDKLKLIGQGHQGKVYLLPNSKPIEGGESFEQFKNRVNDNLKMHPWTPIGHRDAFHVLSNKR
jgi:hypothetical protein